jgi:hypothetical protein
MESMESLLKPVTLSPDVVLVLEEIRTGAENALYGTGSAESEELFRKHVLSLVEGAGLPVLQVIHYRWFLRELARLWRTRKGRDLAFHLELTIRKWVNLGLEPRTLQFLVCEAHERLKGCQPPTADRQPPTASTLTPDPQPLTPDNETAKVAKTAKAEPGSSVGTEQSVESAKSVDVRFGPGPDTGILESSTPGSLR